MHERAVCLVVAPDGRQRTIALPLNLIKAGGVSAPDWLVRQMELPFAVKTDWRLIPVYPIKNQAVDAQPSSLSHGPEGNMLCLARSCAAGASKGFDPRQARLKKERLALEKLNGESDYVRVTPQDALPGSEPEKYNVLFICRGITGIDSAQQPIYADRHEVSLYCDDDFPSDVPRLRWETLIWHPNIQHDQDKAVCVNKPEWLGGMGLVDLLRLMFEMVQYKNYHADLSPPFPLDQIVAKWVREYAEPRGIVDKNRGVTVDNKPFTRPTVTDGITVLAPPTRRIKLISTPTPPESSPSGSRVKLIPDVPSGPPASGGHRIKLVEES